MGRPSKFPQWKGFEANPEGCLLEQVIDLSGEIGFAYERSCEYYKDFHTHDRLMLVLPRGSSSMSVRTRKTQKSFAVDSGKILVVPRDLEHDDQATSAIYDTMALYPTDRQIQNAAKRISAPPAAMAILAKDCRIIPRPQRLDQLIQEYFFERVLSKKDSVDSDAEYLGRKILEETLKCIFTKLTSSKNEVAQINHEEPVTARALKYIEMNLFEPLDVSEIAKHSGASISTLLRKFRSEVKTTPYAYMRNRRLEEAYLLLTTGAHSVGDVALLVGYENFGSFSESFKQKYRVSPSRIRSQK